MENHFSFPVKQLPYTITPLGSLILGCSQLQVSGIQLAELQALLQRHVPHSEVWAYGSRISGMAHEGSDLDLVLCNPSDLSQDVDGWTALKDAVQESSLPMLVDIHLWAHLPISFHPEIEESHVVLQSGVNCVAHSPLTEH